LKIFKFLIIFFKKIEKKIGKSGISWKNIEKKKEISEEVMDFEKMKIYNYYFPKHNYTNVIKRMKTQKNQEID